MDAAVAWLQVEQLGPAKDTWLDIWETNIEIHQLEQQQQQRNMAVTNSNNNNNNISGNNNNNSNASLDSNTNNNNSNKTNDGSGNIMPPQQPVPSSPPPIEQSSNNTKHPSTGQSSGSTATSADDTTPVVSANGPGVGHTGHQQQGNGNRMMDRSYNPTRRKLPEKNENKASTFNMNKYHQSLIKKYGGCPWYNKNKKYGPGIIGWVW